MMIFFRLLILGGMYTCFTCIWRGWRRRRFWRSTTSNSSLFSYQRFTFFIASKPSLPSFMINLLYHELHQFKGLEEIIFSFVGTQFMWRRHPLLMRSPLNLYVKSLKLAFSSLEFFFVSIECLQFLSKLHNQMLWYHKIDPKTKVLLINRKLV